MSRFGAGFERARRMYEQAEAPAGDPAAECIMAAADKLEDLLRALRDEREDFAGLELRHLPVGLRAAVLEHYDLEISHRAEELRDMKARLAQLGYAA